MKVKSESRPYSRKRRITMVICCTLIFLFSLFIIIFLFSLFIIKMAVFGIYGTIYLIVGKFILLICIASALGPIGLTMFWFWLYSDLGAEIIIISGFTICLLIILIILILGVKK